MIASFAFIAPEADAKIQLDLGQLLLHASWPVKATVLILVVSSIAVWLIGVVKLSQLARLRAAEERFESATRQCASAADLAGAAASAPSAPGSRILRALHVRPTTSLERLRAVADRAIVHERKLARALLMPLGSIATAAPFVGLFGTVYGIMDAFVRIGAAKSASLPIVAPAIGEALVTTAIGLAVAIPAVVFYNAVEKRISDFVAELEASAGEWVVVMSETAIAPNAERPAPPFPSSADRR